jgi:hypothetical protein
MVAACAVVVSCFALLFVVSQGSWRPLGYCSGSRASGQPTCGRVAPRVACRCTSDSFLTSAVASLKRKSERLREAPKGVILARYKAISSLQHI